MVMATTQFDAERVRWIRATLGLTQEEFAKRFHVNVSSVRAWEQGQAVPTRGPVIGKLLAAEREAQRIASAPPEGE
jgi:putative transcriptional regulator